MNASVATAHQLSLSSSPAEGTPVVQPPNDIPIDPALGIPTLDPALFAEPVLENNIEVSSSHRRRLLTLRREREP